jgi:hypothetical protein
MTAWLGVVSREHVLRGISLGVTQVNHGKRPPLARMAVGDVMVYYSPRTGHPDGEPLKAFTAYGCLVGDEIWQGDEGDFHPWRRRVDWSQSAVETPIRPLVARLELTADSNWGYSLRRGLLRLSDSDAAIIRSEMHA